MTTYMVDSWGPTQLERLRDFFRRAKAGDTVVFDRELAQRNGRPGDTLDENGCNQWVLTVANQALSGSGLDQDVVNGITLRTDYLHSAYPQKIVPGDAPGTAHVPEAVADEALWGDEGELDIDPEADSWAAMVARYQNRHEPD